jgi:transketolase
LTVDAADFLKKNDGLSVRVLNMHTIKPIDREAIEKAVMDTRRIITFEDHSIIGGLGSAVAEVIADLGKGCAFKRVGIPDEFSPVGYPEDLYHHYKLDSDGIIETVREVTGKEFEEDEDWQDELINKKALCPTKTISWQGSCFGRRCPRESLDRRRPEDARKVPWFQ